MVLNYILIGCPWAVCFNFIEFPTVTGDETGLTSQLLLKGYTTPPWSMPTTLYKQQSGFYTLFPLALTCKKTDVNLFIYLLFILFYFICHTIITKNMGKEEKKKWQGDLTETIGAYERLGLLEL